MGEISDASGAVGADLNPYPRNSDPVASSAGITGNSSAPRGSGSSRVKSAASPPEEVIGAHATTCVESRPDCRNGKATKIVPFGGVVDSLREGSRPNASTTTCALVQIRPFSTRKAQPTVNRFDGGQVGVVLQTVKDLHKAAL